MNNDDSPATNPGGIDRAPTVKRVSSRDESRIYKGSNDDYSMRSKLSDTFGQLLDEEAIKAIADVVHGDNQKCCSLCKSSSEGLVMNVIQILCQFMIKKYELPVCKENFTTKATTPSCDGSPTLNLGIKYPGTDTMKALTPKSQGIVTPAVKEVSPNPVISGNSKPVPAHVMKKRIHSKIDNGRALSIANLFPPDNIPADSVVRVNKLGLPAGIHAEECSPTNNASEVCVIKEHEDKQSTEINYGKLRPPPVNTPIVINVFAQHASAVNFKPAPIQTMNRRLHFAELAKHNILPCIDLFNSEDLFHLSFSDSEPVEEDVGKAGPKAAAPVENGKSKSVSTIPIPTRPPPSKPTCGPVELTHHSTPISNCSRPSKPQNGAAHVENCKSKSVSPIPIPNCSPPRKSTHGVVEPTCDAALAPDVVITKVCHKSPAVELLGETKFSDKCLNQSKLADNMYNAKNLICGEPPNFLLTTTEPRLLDIAQTNIPRNPSPQVNRFPITRVSERFIASNMLLSQGLDSGNGMFSSPSQSSSSFCLQAALPCTYLRL